MIDWQKTIKLRDTNYFTPPRNADRPTWKLEEFNQGPAIASFADWENGPESLRAPGMPLWKPIIQ